MIKDCSTCVYCEWSRLHKGYVCENEDSSYYGDIDDWLDGCCDKWVNESEGVNK